MKYVKSRKSPAEKGSSCSLTFLLLPSWIFLDVYKVYTTAMEMCTQQTATGVMELACRNIIPLHCIFPPSYCADDYSKALSCGMLCHMMLRMLKTHIWVQKQVEEINGRGICWVLILRCHIQLREVPVSKWLEAWRACREASCMLAPLSKRGKVSAFGCCLERLWGHDKP